MDPQLLRIESKLDQLLSAVRGRDVSKRHLNARDVELLTGLDHRTVLNRAKLPVSDRRHIPSLTLGSSRRYFERSVILRLFHLD